MKKDIELQEIGKNTPFEAPKGFFDEISEKTLRKAKFKEQNHRRNLTLWKTLAVAATLAAVAFIGYVIDDPSSPDNELIVQKTQPLSEPVVEKKSEISEDPTVAIVKNDSVKKTSPATQNAENMTDVLAELSDEELILLAAMFKSDPFLDEAMQ